MQTKPTNQEEIAQYRGGVSSDAFRKMTGAQARVLAQTKETVKSVSITDGFMMIETECP